MILMMGKVLSDRYYADIMGSISYKNERHREKMHEN